MARDEEVLRLRGEVQRQKNRYKLLWRMNCENVAEHDATLSEWKLKHFESKLQS